ncbi:MAG: hypothetical protein UV56_C0011G0003 [Candidatus Woesebacteria bacterium GW2011_GWC1_43_10b]|uniref:Uncharacterized protein n=2 Tax=Candidatus Woeseibacteriota TaxID=1752722 RepID=A0A0G0LW16_9BACT|nr:MAG: hypothetical protein UT23_C0040G0002 [Candidatus Woesebacteria bacterium GW2011_GWA1_39_12]KKS80701.1 MAG: hypothetical protein UV56_C0011G0003 [Candidatus Woesebacteria bacterium GW2011_GWC1_43_10b]
MKRILRVFATETFSIYLVSQIASGLVFDKGIQSVLITGLALTGATFLVRPIVNLLLLPLNIMTFGFLRWLSHAVTLFLVDLVLPEFGVLSFSFSGFRSELFSLPPVILEAGPFSYIAFSFILALITTIIYWLVD